MENQLNTSTDLKATAISFKKLVEEVSNKGIESVDAVAVGKLSDLKDDVRWGSIAKKFYEPFGGVADRGLVGYLSKNMKVMFLRYKDGELRSVVLSSGYNKKIKAFVDSLKNRGVYAVETIDQLKQASWKQIFIVLTASALIAFLVF